MATRPHERDTEEALPGTRPPPPEKEEFSTSRNSSNPERWWPAILDTVEKATGGSRRRRDGWPRGQGIRPNAGRRGSGHREAALHSPSPAPPCLDGYSKNTVMKAKALT